VCGEMASQPLTAYALIGLGVRTMSVSPRSVGLLKRLVRGTTASTAAGSASAAMEARTAAASEAVILESFTDTFGEVAELLDGLPHVM
jgi:phosphoenolpyruvate-protein phosphotransferase (PTS system enzyme I)